MKKHLLVLSLTFFGAISVFAQRTISGKVTDEFGEPLIGASVLVKGTSSGTVTDIDGSYSLSVPSLLHSISCSLNSVGSEKFLLHFQHS